MAELGLTPTSVSLQNLDSFSCPSRSKQCHSRCKAGIVWNSAAKFKPSGSYGWCAWDLETLFFLSWGTYLSGGCGDNAGTAAGALLSEATPRRMGPKELVSHTAETACWHPWTSGNVGKGPLGWVSAARLLFEASFKGIYFQAGTPEQLQLRPLWFLTGSPSLGSTTKPFLSAQPEGALTSQLSLA